MPAERTTKKASKRSGGANGKKNAPSSLQQVQPPALFEVDTAGDATVRRTLLHDAAPAAARLRKGTSFNKPLKSDQILAARSSVPALRSKIVPSTEVQAKKTKEKLGRVDRATKEKLKRIVGRDGQGDGLWGVKSGGDQEEALTEAVRKAGEYDAWHVVAKKSKYNDEAMDEAIIASTTGRAPKVSLSQMVVPVEPHESWLINCSLLYHITGPFNSS